MAMACVSGRMCVNWQHYAVASARLSRALMAALPGPAKCRRPPRGAPVPDPAWIGLRPKKIDCRSPLG